MTPAAMSTGRKPQAELVVDDEQHYRFVVVLDEVRSAPSSQAYPTREAAWAAASRCGLQTPQD